MEVLCVVLLQDLDQSRPQATIPGGVHRVLCDLMQGPVVGWGVCVCVCVCVCVLCVCERERERRKEWTGGEDKKATQHNTSCTHTHTQSSPSLTALRNSIPLNNCHAFSRAVSFFSTWYLRGKAVAITTHLQ